MNPAVFFIVVGLLLLILIVKFLDCKEQLADVNAPSEGDKPELSERGKLAEYIRNLLCSFLNLIPLIGLILAVLGYFNIREQIQLAYPAKFKIANLSIYDGTPENAVTRFSPGQSFEGEASVINVGRQRAVEFWGNCCPYWKKGNLPMYRPYLSDRPSGCQSSSSRCDYVAPDGKTSPPRWFFGRGEPGSVLKIKFRSTVPQEYKEDMEFCFLGVMNYSDDISKHLFVLFAKCFDRAKGRFVAVNNPDYEDEPEK